MSKIKQLYDSKFEALHDVAFSGSYNNLSDTPVLGTAAGYDASAFATSGQGALADTALQSGSVSQVALTGDYGDLSNTPTLGTIASHDTTEFATAAQGVKADNALSAVPVPSGATASGVSGTFAYDSDWVYFCVSTDTWVRIPTSLW